MARRKKKRRQSARNKPAAPEVAAQQTQAAPSTDKNAAPDSRGRLWTALLVTALWGLALVTLALLTANPATLNRAQIRQADVIIVGRIKDVERGTVVVEKTWKSGPDTGATITVPDLDRTKAQNNSRFLMPLSRLPDGGYEIARPKLPGQGDEERQADLPLRIYPTSDDVLTQLHEILGR